MENENNDLVLSDEDEFLNKLHRIVSETIKEEDLILNNLLHPAKDVLTGGQKLSDQVARFGGSWRFIIIFMIILTVWIIYNVKAVGVKAFDPYPFILMNLVLSCVAAMQAPIIMMSQNRQEEKDRIRAENDYLINMKAELEVRSLHQKMDLLLEEQIKTLFEVQAKQLELLKKLTERVDSLCTKNNL